MNTDLRFINGIHHINGILIILKGYLIHSHNSLYKNIITINFFVFKIQDPNKQRKNFSYRFSWNISLSGDSLLIFTLLWA